MKKISAAIELQITHDGNYWFAENNFFKAQACDLLELEEKIKNLLPRLLLKNPGEEIKVSMRYNYAAFPEWLHQYHTHYFNRILTFQSRP